jgi:uncharacterized protein (DUF779 family)
MCYAQGDFLTGDSDVRSSSTWSRGGMFSLENGEGVRFLTRSPIFTDEEYTRLKTAEGGPSLLRQP